MTDAPKKSRPIEVVADAEPIKLGSILFTVVDPHRGHEVDYNRWYERDHFYSGVMIGPWTFAGNRYVATKDLKALRDPSTASITGEAERGSYVGVYWVLDGFHDLWNKWSVRQVRQLHAKNRMFEHRDHIHTLLYKFEWEFGRDEDGVPIELALDHNYPGFVAVWVDAAEGVTREEMWTHLQADILPEVLPGTSAGLVGAFTPLPLLIDAPGDVPRQDSTDQRTMLLYFLDEDPKVDWDAVFVRQRQLIADAGKGQVIAEMPFKPTIKGTDTYTDELWLD